MNKAKKYMLMKSDLAGSRTKNRFRLELLWGISKMLELMESSDDFTVVFDYVCDIEVHKDDSFEFYQVKTHKEGQKSYTPKNLVSYKKGQEGSILGKLFSLTNSEGNIKIVLVCNLPFSALSKTPGITSLDRLSESDQLIIKEAVKKELRIEDIDLSDSFYLYTHMNLSAPEKEIIGELVTAFERIKGSEPINPNALYRLVYDDVQEKACYEYSLEDYDLLLQKKGISRKQFDHLLEAHCSSEKTGVKAVRDYIDKMPNFRDRRVYKKALGTLIPKISKSRVIQNMEIEMVKELIANDEITSIDAAMDYLTNLFHDKFPVEYDNAEKTVCYMLVVKKFEEGGYDDAVDI